MICGKVCKMVVNYLRCLLCCVYKEERQKGCWEFHIFQVGFLAIISKSLEIHIQSERKTETNICCISTPPPHRGGGHFLDQSNTYKKVLLPQTADAKGYVHC